MKLGEALICGESCWLLPLPLVPLLKLLMRDRALSEAEVGSPLEGDEKEEAQPGSVGRGSPHRPPLRTPIPSQPALHQSCHAGSSSPAQALSVRLLMLQRHHLCQTPGLFPSGWQAAGDRNRAHVTRGCP